MKSRRFTPEEQRAFAQLSGDFNPLHVDAMAARRLLYGAPVVHGIHSLLWGLDAWVKESNEPLQLRSIEVSFPKPLRLGDEARMLLNHVGDRRVKIEISCGESVVTSIEFEWMPRTAMAAPELDTGFPEQREPRVVTALEIGAQSGALGLSFHREAATKMFPHLVKFLPARQIAALLGTTRLVGMECPGCHSVFFELKLGVHTESQADSIKYEVTKFDRRFGMILMNVTAPGLAGVIQAFLRPVPQEQITFGKAKALVASGEFSGQCALVVGGSRGLGEVTAKLLAAGGAEVKITYHQGRTDAQRIVEETTGAGGRVGSLQLDVLATSPSNLSASLADWSPSHLYYFATPFIFAGVKGGFSADLFRKFCDYYVTGFLDLVNAVKGRGTTKIFHPSSVVVDEAPPDMGEYAAAKAAAEVLCLSLKKNHPTLAFYQPRLPRMGTDQTVSLFPVNNQDPVPIMLEHLRVFKSI